MTIARDVAPPVHLHGVTYMQQWVRCGNPRCRTCPHGPYWYAFYARPASKELMERRGRRGKLTRIVTTVKGGTMRKYIGKEIPPSILEAFRVASETDEHILAEAKRERRRRGR